jgi:ABC-type transport system substrate-binding protein
MQRISLRKSLTKASMGALTAAFVASGISGVAVADEICPKRGGTFNTVDLVYANIDSSQRANPIYFMSLLYDTLLDVNHDLSLSPGLAAEMPQKVDDLTYVFKLRKGVKFHDGTEFNAQAVKHNVDRLIVGKIKSPFSGVWRKFSKAVTVVDDYTVKFEAKQTWPTFLWDVATSLRFASPTAVEKLGEDYGVKGAVGTGPFMFKDFKPKKEIELVRNPNYYRTGEPCLDGFKSKVIKSGSVRILTLKKGELDLINTFPESQFPQFKGVDNVIVEEGIASTLTLLPLNTKHPLLADKRVRQAIQLAVSGKELIDNVYGGAGAEVESIFPPWHPAFVKADDLSPVRQNVEKAKELLAAAGYGPGGKKLVLTLETGSGGAHVQRGVLIQAQLQAVGIDLKVKNISMGQALSNMYAGKFHMVLWQMLGGPTIKDYAWNMYSGGGTNNHTFYNKEGGYQNPRVDELANEIVKTNDPNEVRDQIKELQKLVFEDVPVVFLNFRNHRAAYQSYVKNYKISKLKGRDDIRRVWLDK